MSVCVSRAGTLWRSVGVFAACLVATSAAWAQEGQTEEPQTTDWEQQAEVELPEVTVYGAESSSDQLVGPYEQPAWTARQQRFPTTRAYVLPPGVVEFEVFSEVTGSDGDGEGPEYEFQEEIKLGLPWRIQLDLYYVQERPTGGEIESTEYKIELRHALADWGEIPLNPTLYLEYEGPLQDEGTQELEYKLLLADTLKPRLHWAGNLIFEQDLEVDKIEYGASTGISYALIDNKFAVGAEAELIWEEEGDEDVETEFTVGPSLEYRPTNNTSVRFTPMFGIGPDSPDFRAFLVFGIGIGPGEPAEYIGPAGAEMR